MYCKYYHFQYPPFNLTPDSRFFYASQKHLETLNTLVYAITERKGFVVITGEIGSGKTTTCRTLLNRLEASTRTALITNTHLSSKDLLITILEDLEVDFIPGSKARLLSQLNAYLINQLRLDNNVVVILDEAQNLSPSVLEEVRMLSNLETENEKLIQIILMGQPELKQKLGLKRLEQLRQRIAFFYHLKPLTFDETKEYILHRLRVAGGAGRKYFTDEAVNLIAHFAGGIPRVINLICDNAFLTGYTYNHDMIDAGIVHGVIRELPMNIIAGEKKSQDEKKPGSAGLHNVYYGQLPGSDPSDKGNSPEEKISFLN